MEFFGHYVIKTVREVAFLFWKDMTFVILQNIQFYCKVALTYEECVRDKLDDRTTTCRKVRC